MVQENGAQNHLISGRGHPPPNHMHDDKQFLKEICPRFSSSALNIKRNYPVIQGSNHGDL
jgi:hypothetical protein